MVYPCSMRHRFLTSVGARHRLFMAASLTGLSSLLLGYSSRVASLLKRLGLARSKSLS